MCIGRSAGPNARIATSTPMSATAASTKRASSPPICTELRHFASLTPGRTVTSIFFGGGTPSLMRPATVAAILDAIAGHWHIARRCGDHARSQSDERRGRELRRLSRGRRQSAVARRAGARRSKPEGARPPAHGRRSARRARARQAPFRPRVVRPDLCASGTDGDCLGSGATPRARPRRRPSLAVSAHHRGRHAVRRASCGRLAAHPRRRAGERALWPDPGALRGGGTAGLRDLQPCAAGIGVAAQSALLARARLCGRRPRRA